MQTVSSSDFFINIKTLQYPISLGDIRVSNPALSFGHNPSREFIFAKGYDAVVQTPKPTGDVVVELEPVLEDGLWRQVWSARDYNDSEIACHLESAKHSREHVLRSLYASAIEKGAEVGFGNKPHLRACIKDSSVINLLVLKSLALDAIREGDDWSAFEFRGLGGEVVSLEAVGAIDLVSKALARRSALKSLLGSLVDSVKAALVMGDIDHSENAFEIE